MSAQFESRRNNVEQMIQPVNLSSATSAEVKIDFNPILAVRELGVKDMPSQLPIPVGVIGLALHNENPYDYEGFPQVFLPGEVISKYKFRKEESCIVVQMGETPGRITLQVSQFLAGISADQGDTAVANFIFYLRLVDPIRLLGMQSNWRSQEGQDKLISSLKEFVLTAVNSLLQEDLQLWSSDYISIPAGKIFSHLDAILQGWGLGLQKNLVAFRKYPNRLAELALQLRAAEQEFIDLEGTKTGLLGKRLGLKPSDILEMLRESERQCIGIGFLRAVLKLKHQSEPILAWLVTKADPAFFAETCLRELCLTNIYGLQMIALSEQVLVSAIRNPVLGLGEWQETQAEPRIKSPFEDPQPDNYDSDLR